MAAFLSPTPQILQRPQTLSTLLSKPSQRQCLILPRASATPIHRKFNQFPDSPHLSTNDWSFEQRIQEALDVLDLMEAQGLEPEPSLFCTLLKSCADAENLEFGKTIHSKIVGTQLENDVFVANNLINLYSKCGCFETARELFDKMPVRNTVSWTSIISMYSQYGFHEEALRLYSLMKWDRKVRPNLFTYTIALSSCAKTGNLKMGIEIHEDLVKDGCETDDFIVTALIDFYSKCGKIDNARLVFDMIEDPTFANCTAMIDGYNMNNRSKDAINLIRRILRSGLDLKEVKDLGFTCMIRSCTMEKLLRQGQEIHANMIKFGYKPGAQTIIALIILYEKCEKMVIARRLFDELLVKNVALWGRMISGYVRNGLNQEALELYFEMVCEDVEPNPFTLSSAVNACVGILGLKEAKEIHCRAIKAGYGLSEDVIVVSLVKLYREFGLLEDVQKVVKCHRNQR
ncbi:Pentatricopeptide repeat [Macleaya cordata]|uniref:Pentatricopeptide repeat n=1 Tax=Macleaya cordata TaxID=56857 RepID=A0A200PMV6_MACCD|nr:Pentatricopeptide repeat [Macleaya cordata]